MQTSGVHPSGGGAVVRSQTVYEFHPTAVRTATSSPRSSFVSGSLVSICDSPAYVRAIEEQRAASNRDGLGCVRGLCAAFVLEGGLALLLFAIRQLWHVAR
jgi:hypothetical protein